MTWAVCIPSTVTLSQTQSPTLVTLIRTDVHESTATTTEGADLLSAQETCPGTPPKMTRLSKRSVVDVGICDIIAVLAALLC